MLFARHTKILAAYELFSVSLGAILTPKRNCRQCVCSQNFGLTKKEHYGMFWYFLEWSSKSI